jgi:hypothetical protein
MKTKSSTQNPETKNTDLVISNSPPLEAACEKTPSLKPSRDNRGLRIGIEYTFNDDGTINWRKMLKPEHLCFNSQKADSIAKKLSIDSKLIKFAKVGDYNASLYEDSDLLILLSGIKYLAWLRGYSTVDAKLIQAAYNIASVNTHITWIPNFETGFASETYSDAATATLDNTMSFGNAYLTEMAINRAFSRVVRNYLNINIVAKEEIGPDTIVNNQKSYANQTASVDKITKPRALLSEKLTKLGMTFDNFRDLFIKKYVNNSDKSLNVILETDPLKWTNANDFSENDVLTILSIVSK